jgi:hypothetical protein
MAGQRGMNGALAPATASVWPYEAMYDDEVKASGYLDNNVR